MLSRCVIGGLCHPHDNHLFTSRTNGALCHEEDAWLSGCHSSHSGVPTSELSKPSPPRRRKKGTGSLQGNLRDASEIAAAFPPRHPKINGNIWGEVTLQGDSPVAGDSRQNLFREKGPGYIYTWAGCAPPQSQLGRAPRKPGSRQVFRDCSLLLQKCRKSALPAAGFTGSRVHGLIHSLTHSLSYSTHIYQAPAVCQAPGIRR